MDHRWHRLAGWPNLAAESPLTLLASDVTLPTAEAMLALAQQLWQQGKALPPEQAEPTYLRNEVTWKNCRGAHSWRQLIY